VDSQLYRVRCPVHTDSRIIVVMPRRQPLSQVVLVHREVPHTIKRGVEPVDGHRAISAAGHPTPLRGTAQVVPRLNPLHKRGGGGGDVAPAGRPTVVGTRPAGVGVADRGVTRLDVDPHSEPDDHVAGSTGTGVADRSRSRGRAEVLAVSCLVFERVLAGRRLYAELACPERRVVLPSDALLDIGN